MLFLNFIQALITMIACTGVWFMGSNFNPAVGVASFPFMMAVALTLGDLAEEWLIHKFNSET